MQTKVIRSGDVGEVAQEWGALQWFTGGAEDGDLGMTVGRVTFKPGESNPPHFHPNCSEVLVVVSGVIEHSLPDGGVARLEPGDCIVLPEGEKHNARNIGEDDAVAIIAFNSAHRETVGE